MMHISGSIMFSSMTDIMVVKNQDILHKLSESEQCNYVTSINDYNAVQLNEYAFGVLHLNIRSFYKNEAKLIQLLDDICQKVTVHVILLCETFLNSNNVALAEISGFTSFHKMREDRKGGGVSIFVKNDIVVTEQLNSKFKKILRAYS